MSNELDSGAASLKITKRDGVITVYHGSEGHELYSGVAPKGAWKKIVAAILEAVPEGSGIMKGDEV